MKLYTIIMLLVISSVMYAEEYRINICTGADAPFFKELINFIGSVFKHNKNNLGDLWVYDLGLNQEQIQWLNNVEHVQVRKIEPINPYITFPIQTTLSGKRVPGAYSFKAAALKDMSDYHDHFFWIDAGTTFLGSLNPLYELALEQGYFFHNGSDWCIARHATERLKERFNLKAHDKAWILAPSTHGLEAGFMGITRAVYDSFVMPLYNYAHDISYFLDDGTCPGGFGNARHDQSLFSIVALSNNFFIYHHFEHPEQAWSVTYNSTSRLVHIACIPSAIGKETIAYCSRRDIPHFDHYSAYITFKGNK
ncbi:hypothetical protein KG892_01615 [Vermiphilus pyriformis]|uniref:Uncharacterized protein n=1 Tax=candidate division TM6 bacterium JCVI TM6SC1 TaxID=1306947 RepID=A0A0D2K5U9_9BACT|nr:hypothetical protein J120_01545 [candidate division TM6 bacterium JCVI TM6SC1]UNE35699.1 MAG: hypothetical protein KG892_01615 [Vermiphilus pyriformis]